MPTVNGGSSHVPGLVELGHIGDQCGACPLGHASDERGWGLLHDDCSTVKAVLQ